MEERRHGNKELIVKIDSVLDRQGVIKNYIEGLFGSIDLVGTPVEGTVSKQLRELNEKVKIQNGRIGKLENWRWFVVGCTAVAVIAIGLFIKKG